MLSDRRISMNGGERGINLDVGFEDDRDDEGGGMRAYCDIHLMRIMRDQPRYHCDSCLEADFNACPRCVELGGGRLDESHMLIYYATSPGRY